MQIIEILDEPSPFDAAPALLERCLRCDQRHPGPCPDVIEIDPDDGGPESLDQLADAACDAVALQLYVAMVAAWSPSFNPPDFKRLRGLALEGAKVWRAGR